MSKCPNCGADVENGMKFCGECGTKIPQNKNCPKCGTEIPVVAKFCGECGYNFNGSGSSGGGSVIGDKNVIAGDVNVTNTTNYINQDETKKIVKCTVCGVGVLITEAHKCSCCSEYVCADHYDSECGKCTHCIAEQMRAAETEYRKTLEYILEDGIVDQAEFEQLEQLRKKLGIAAPRAMELQKQMKIEVEAKKSPAKKSDALMTVEKAQCERAKAKLYDEGDYVEAYNLIFPIYKSHPLNEKVLAVYLTAMTGIDEDKTRSIIAALPVDMVSAYLTLVDIEIKHGELASAEMKLAAAEKLWPTETHAKLRRILLMYATAKQTDDRAYLAEAMDLLTSLPPATDKLTTSWQFFLQYVISQFLGDEVPELTKEFCHDEGVYFAFVRGELLGQKAEIEDDSIAPGEIEEELNRANELYESACYAEDDEELSNALKAYVRLAKAGCTEAMTTLACMYEGGEGTEIDFAAAAEWLNRAANADCHSAWYHLADLYAKGGPGLEKDEGRAVHFMKRCASYGDASAYVSLGDWYRDGEVGLPTDNSRAIVYYNQAAEKGFAPAMRRLAEMYRDGKGVVKDLQLAKKWFEDALSKGGWCLEDSKRIQHEIDLIAGAGRLTQEEADALDKKGVEARRKGDFPKALECFRKAAEVKHGLALLHLGIMYHKGEGAAKDIKRWLELMEESVSVGCGLAARLLALAYRDGKDVSKDMEKFHTNFNLAIKMEDPPALYLAGGWHLRGEYGFKKDEKRGLILIKHSAELGNTGAMCRLGSFYEKGDYVEKSITTAIGWYKKAIDRGEASAATLLAWLYAGDKCGADEDAVKYMRLAVEMGHADAMDSLGYWYENGSHGLPVDVEKAVRYYRMSAEKGEGWGMYHLGLMYKNGKGVHADKSEAISWLEKAVATGHEKASKALSSMGK